MIIYASQRETEKKVIFNSNASGLQLEGLLVTSLVSLSMTLKVKYLTGLPDSAAAGARAVKNCDCLSKPGYL